MPVFRVQMPDGRVARIQADSGDEALSFAKSSGSAPPAPAAKPGPSADYQAERSRADKFAAGVRKEDEQTPWFLGGGAGGAITHAVGNVLPVLDEVNAGLRAGGNEVWNRTYRAATGEKPVNSADIYKANMDASAADEAARLQAHPVASTVGGLLGGLVGGEAAGGTKAVAGVVKGTGAAARALSAVKAAGAGAGYGGLYGFLDGNGQDDRLTKGKQGAEGGALLGGLLDGVVAPQIEKLAPLVGKIGDNFTAGFGDALRAATGGEAPLLGKAGQAVIGGVKRAVGLEKPPLQVGPVPATPSEATAAAKAAFNLANKKGLTADTVAARAAPFAGKDVTAAELIGPEGVTQAAATARRAGQTGDAVRAKMRARQLAAPQRIQDDFQQTLGLSPEFAAGDVESMVERARANADPAYAAALGSPDGVWNPDLERLHSLPDVRRAFTGAENSERIAQRGANGLTYGRVEVPDPRVDTPPPVEASAPEGPAPRAPAKAPSQGPSLIQFMAAKGGGDDVGGDLAAMGADKWHVGRAFQGKALGTEDLDHLANLAWGAGYFPESQTRPTVNDLLEAVRDELRGNKRFAREPDQSALDRMGARDAHDEAVYRGHQGGPEPSEDDYGQAPGPQFEPARMEAPTAATWDKVKKHISNMVERDPITNRVITSGPTGQRNRDLATLAGHLTDALAGDGSHPGAIPGYRAALDAGGDAPRMQAAFDKASGRLTNGTARDFSRLWQSFKTDGERAAAKGALASDIMTLWGRGQLRGGKFALPGVQAKLEMAFGKKEAAAFVQRMEAEAQLAASGNRMAPYSGSPTMGLGEAANEQDAAGNLHMRDLERIGHKLTSGHPFKAAADAVGTAAGRALARKRTSGMTEGMRDEYGRILQMAPDEFEAFLRHWQAQPDAIKRRYPLPAGLMAGGAAGANAPSY